MLQNFKNNNINDGTPQTYDSQQKKEISSFNNNTNYASEHLSKRLDDIELQIHNIKTKDTKNNVNNEVYYMEDKCNCDCDILKCYRSTKDYGEEIVEGEKCEGINVLCYLFGTFCGAIPLGFGFALVVGLSTENSYIPWIILVSCMAAIIMSSCLFCIFKLIIRSTEDYNYGSKMDIEDTCFSCCININNSDHGVDLNMFVYICCFLIIGIPIGIAFQYMTLNNSGNYNVIGWICIVSSIVWLIFLSLIIIMIKLFKTNQE